MDRGEDDAIQAVLDAIGGLGSYTPRLGAGDDAAWLQSGEVVTTDTMIEGIHFDHRLSAEDLGWKLVAVNASDVGAMGGRPTWGLLTLGLPRPLDRAWLAGFCAGLAAACARYGIRLVGGDTTRSPGPVVVGLTLAGAAARPVLRSGGRPGDQLWVSGTLGDAAAGFLGVRGVAPPDGLAWLRRPEPPVALGAALGEQGLATAMMDLSDGLRRDLHRLCAASGAGASVDPDALPRGPALEGAPDPVPYQVGFGDDYQLLFSAPPERAPAIRALAADLGVRVSPIGHLDAGPAVTLRGRAWPPLAWTHFDPDPAGPDPDLDSR